MDARLLKNNFRRLTNEIEPEILLSKVLEISAEMANADRGLILLPDENGWRIEIETPPSHLTHAGENSGFPLAILDSAVRIRKSVALENAAQTGPFTDNAYIIDARIKSMLCVPMVWRNQIGGALYLESNQTAGIFTPALVAAIELLVIQTAISIENAELFSELKESENKYRGIFENAVEGIFQSTPDGRIIIANPSIARIHGYDSADAFMSSVTDIRKQLYVNPTDREKLGRLMAEKGRVSGFESQMFRKDGSKIWTSMSARALNDKTGGVFAYEGLLLDITERKFSEEKQKRQKEILETRTAELIAANSKLRREMSERRQTESALVQARDVLSELKRPAKSLYFAKLGTFCLALILAAVGAFYWLQGRNQSKNTGIQENSMRFLVSGIEKSIRGKSRDASRILADTPDIEAAAAGRLEPDAEEILRILVPARKLLGASIVYVMDKNGTVTACTPYEKGETLTGKNYSFRPYFQKAMNGVDFFYPALGVTTKKRGLYFSMPIRSHGKIIGVVVIKYGLEEIDRVLANTPYPTALIVDGGIVFASNKREWLYHSAFPMDWKKKADVMASGQFADIPIGDLPFNPARSPVSYNNTEYSVGRKPVGLESWELLCLIPIPDYPVYEYFLILAGLFAIFGTYVAYLVASGKKRELTAAIIHSYEHLRDAEKKYRGIFENASDGIFQTGADGRILTVNPALARLLGYDSPEEAMQNITDHGRKFYADRSKRKELVRLLEANRRVSDFEFKACAKNGKSIDVSISAHAIEDEDGNPLYFEGILRPATKKRGPEAVRPSSNPGSDNGENDFLAAMSHEVRTPMNAIIGMAELLSDTEMTVAQRDCVDAISVSANSLLPVLDNILVYSGIQAGRLGSDDALSDAPVPTLQAGTDPRHPEEEAVPQFDSEILLVEDNDLNQRVATGLLKRHGCHPDIAGNGKIALERVGRKRYDLIFMDIQMPVMDGIRATRAIREMEAGEHRVPIIAMTAMTMRGDRERCIGAGMDDFVPKPVRPAAILDILRKYGSESCPPQKPIGEMASDPPDRPFPILNPAQLADVCDGDVTIIREIVDAFLTDAEDSFRQFRGAFESGTQAGIAKSAHSLSGLSANIGGENLRFVTLRIEKDALDGLFDPENFDLSALETELNLLKHELTHMDWASYLRKQGG